MSFLFRLTLTASAVLSLASCGGGTANPPPGAGGSDTPPASAATSGRAVDGYIAAATAVCDTNGNGAADAGEASVTTSSAGLYTFAAGCNAVVIVTGGTNADTGLPFRGVLKTPAGAAIASPLTTLLVAGMTQAQVNAAVGLPAGTAPTTLDPAARADGALTNPDLLKRTLALQQLLQKITELFTGLGGITNNPGSQAIYTEVVAAFAAQLPSGPVFGSAADSSVVTALVKAATQRVASSTAVPTGVRTALAAINADSLAQVVTGGLKFQADAILGASGNAIPTAGGAQQADGRITTFVLANVAALSAAPGAATAALASALTAQINGSAPPPPPVTGPVIGAKGELVTFEEGTPPVLTGFGGAENSTIVTDPVSNSGKVAKVVKVADKDWAGTTVSVGPNFSIARVPFTATATTLTVRVWSPDVNVPVRLKLEDAADNKKSVETEARTTLANAWQTLTFDFSKHVTGTPALNLATTYNKASIFFDFGTVGSGKTYYFDDVTFGPGSAPPPPPPNNYLALAADSISLINGNVDTPYSMTQFQSDAGIGVSWPLPSTAKLRVRIDEIGSYVIPAGQKVSAAVSITETTTSGKGEIQAYIDNVDVSKTAGGLQVTVPAGAMAMVYGVSGDGKKKAVIDFSGDVSTGLVTNLLKTASGTSNDILLGSIVNYGINKVSNDFTGIYGLRGKYRVTIVLTDLPLRKADGSALPPLTVTVPTALNATGGVTASKVVTGTGLSGYITLTD